MENAVSAGQMTEVARFEQFEDVRKMSIGTGRDGRLIVRQDVSGPSALASYGDDERSIRLGFSAQAVSELVAQLGTRDGEKDSLWTFLSDEGHDLVDLMDFCDGRRIPYDYTAIGSSSGVHFRPAC